MNENEAKSFILGEAERLNKEEHVNDLAIHKRYDELKNVDVRTNYAVAEYLAANNLELTTDEIPDGSCFPIYLLSNILCSERLIEDDEEIAARLVDEVGDLGKSIAWKVCERGASIDDILWEDIFDDSDAKNYDDEYGTE